MRRLGGEAGQAGVELVAMLPLAVTAMLAAGQLLAAGAAFELASHASQAGAMALVAGREPAGAAREAVPGWSHSRLAVEVEGRRVTVRLRPVTVLPGLAKLLAAESVADAGPAS